MTPQRFDRDATTESARGRGHDVAPLLEMLGNAAGGAAYEIHVDDVVNVGMIGVAAMFDCAELVVRVNDPFGQQEAGCQLTIRTWCSHDDGKWLSMQPDFERLLRRREIFAPRIYAAGEPRYVNTTEWRKRVRHGSGASARADAVVDMSGRPDT